MKKAVFSEPMYGNLQHEIMRSGQLLAAIAFANQGKYPALFDAAKNGERAIDDKLKASMPEVSALFDNHSGASWMAVRWTVVNLLNGYSVRCEGATYKLFWNNEKVFITEQRKAGVPKHIAYFPINQP